MKSCISICLAILLTFELSAQPLSSSNLPLIIINTNGQVIPDDPKITADMGIIFNANNARNNITDPYNHYNGKIGIEVRGQSSQSFPMKSYSIELRDALGNSQDKTLFGLPKESDWVLYAPYTDKTLMRNFLAYTLSNEMGHWAAHCKFVEVVINGDYKGIYVFMEKIKRSTGRLGLTKMPVTDISGDAVTGGYIFSLDKEPNGWFSSFQVPNATNVITRQYSYVYPKPEDIVPAQKDYIKALVDSFERAAASDAFQDNIVGVRHFIDIPSFVDYMIVNEVSRNVDGYRLSSFFYKDRNSKNSKIFAGPVWDYDLAYRNANYCNGALTSGWAMDINYVCPGDGAGLIPFYWYKLANEDTAFRGSLLCRWKSLRSTSLSVNHLNYLIDSIVTLTAEAQLRHFQRWPVLGSYIWPNPSPIATTYYGEINYLKQWLQERLQWIDANLANTGPCAKVPTDEEKSFVPTIYPNPIISQLSLQIKTKMNQEVSLQIMNAIGQKMNIQKIAVIRGDNLITNIKTNNWSAGFYYFFFTNQSGEQVIKKVFKQ